MAGRILQVFLRCGGGLIRTICLCTILFTLLLTASDTTRVANIVAYLQKQSCCKSRGIIISALRSNTQTEMGKKLTSEWNISDPSPKLGSNYVKEELNRRNKYLEWIPYPQQTLSPLSDNPYVIQNKDICQRTKELDVIVLIHSATGNFRRRQGIRNTWGNITGLEQNNMRILFLLGITENRDIQMNILKENKENGDIVQGKFLDTYQNLTHKAVLGLRWVKEFCPGERRVLKVDDDVFINTGKLLSDFFTEFENKPDTIYCTRQDANTSIMQRSENDKWKVDKNEFRNHNYFPLTYCHGFFISMSTSMASKLYEAAYNMPFFWIDDFYVYGMLMDKLGASSNIIDIHHLLSLHTYNSLNCFGTENTKCNLLVGNAPSKEFMQSMWEKMLKQVT